MNMWYGDLWFLVALTPLHVGIGRSPGVVDLPIARDSLGYPWIPASSIKGAVKAACVLSEGDGGECYEYYGWHVDRYSVTEPWVSSIVFTDAFLFAFPVRAVVGGEERIIYVVPKSSVNRLNDLCEDIVRCGSCIGRIVVNEEGSKEEVRIRYFNIGGVKLNLSESLKCVMDRLPSFVRHIIEEDGGVYVVGDSQARHIIELELIRVARIRLDPQRKAVERGALWTEEYVPQATMFVSAVLYRGTRTNRRTIEPRCARDFQRNLLGEINYTLFIGGKETIGKGLVKIIEA